MRKLADIVDEGQAKGEIATQGRPEKVRSADVIPQPIPVPKQRLAECRQRSNVRPANISRCSIGVQIRHIPARFGTRLEHKGGTAARLSQLARTAVPGASYGASGWESSSILAARQNQTMTPADLPESLSGFAWPPRWTSSPSRRPRNSHLEQRSVRAGTTGPLFHPYVPGVFQIAPECGVFERRLNIAKYSPGEHLTSGGTRRGAAWAPVLAEE